jgi:hypothetical protein
MVKARAVYRVASKSRAKAATYRAPTITTTICQAETSRSQNDAPEIEIEMGMPIAVVP